MAQTDYYYVKYTKTIALYLLTVQAHGDLIASHIHRILQLKIVVKIIRSPHYLYQHP